MNLHDYISICDAITNLMHPLTEVVIHNIETSKIVYINGSLSRRKIGDPSLIEKNGLNKDNQSIYPKINFDGRLVKSISVMLEGKYLLCINCDVSIFSKMHELSNTLLCKNMDDQPQSLFVNDWQEKLHASIHTYLRDWNLSFDSLLQRDKKAIVQCLFNLGAFNEKNAPDYIAKVLNLGRATVFKYLKELRNK